MVIYHICGVCGDKYQIHGRPGQIQSWFLCFSCRTDRKAEVVAWIKGWEAGADRKWEG